jgi:hypothetical protein
MMNNIKAFEEKLKQLKDTLEYVQTNMNRLNPRIVKVELENNIDAFSHILLDEKNRKHAIAFSVKRIQIGINESLIVKLRDAGLLNEDLEVFFESEVKRIKKYKIRR